MNEEPLESPASAHEPVDRDGQSTEEKSEDAERVPDAASAQEPVEPSEPDTTEKLSEEPEVHEIRKDIKEEENPPSGEPPLDWFEPLEEDDDVDSRNDQDEESVAGESERSESVAGSEKAFRKVYQHYGPRRRRSHPDEGWVDWPILGEGWKRKEVVRRSGCSIGQKDVYYMSPQGDRVRSRVELVSVVEGIPKMETFDYKSGKFYDGDAPPMRIRKKRRVRERSSSESSWMERGEGADTPDSFYRLTPSQVSKKPQNNETSLTAQGAGENANQGSCDDDSRVRLPPAPSSSTPVLLTNGGVGSDENLLCSKCGVSFKGTWYDKKRKKPCCPTCWAASKTKEHPMIRFRKWIPCGQCVGCRNSINCGQCANCKHSQQNPESRKRLCRKRKCICPIRKGPGSGAVQPPWNYNDVPETVDDSTGFQVIKDEVTDSQHPSLKSSDTENFSVNVDVDEEEDFSTDDDDDWHKKRKRRSCGECKACRCRRDCGTCDFCIDKPKFGGSNKKRQKCRLRQCQRQAMRHLLPFQMGQGELEQEGLQLPGRPRPHYTYSRKPGLKKNRELSSGVDLSDNGEDDFKEQFNHSDYKQRNGLSDKDPHFSNHNTSEEQLSRWDAEKSLASRDDQIDTEEDQEDEEEELPMITQIFSLADNPPESGTDVENQLMKLLQSLRLTAMPVLWYAIMVEGPQLQLIQCSKQSAMTDTIVMIDPGFFYQVTVQKQPLLPTHPLYEKFPGRLTSVTEVVDLLLGLEKYIVCQGLLPPQHLLNKSPFIFERASTCEFLIKKNMRKCNSCRSLQGY